MKFALIPAALLSLALAAPAFAAPAAPADGLEMVGSNPKKVVKFNHSTHKDVTCDTCHHKPRCAICHYSPSLEKSPYASCSTEGCHTVQGRSNQENSRFMAFHDRDSVRSCFGCHQSLSEKYAEFKGCRPCHPGGQEAEGK